MSGVTGYWGYRAEDLTEQTFQAFTHSLKHRGPDGFGIEHFADTRLWLGHRRLAIIDLSERGRQPLSHAGGRYWITYNGTIYNYIELREELTALGHRFVSNTDAEVVVAAYVQWGSHCQRRFNGMWAFAIWDAGKRQLFLSRDRFGMKPLLYSTHDGRIAFASELKAFLTLPWIDGTFDSVVLFETLMDIEGQEAVQRTLLPTVQRLQAGHCMTVEADGRERIEAWWNTLEHLPRSSDELGKQVEEFRALFFDACRLQLRSDAPLAVEQSGGLDSSAIACAVAEFDRNSPIKKSSRQAFVACFPGTEYDESEQARIVVDYTGMKPHYENVDDCVARDNMESIIFDHEIIFSFPRVGSWALYRAMRASEVRVSLNGTGADSLLCNDNDIIESDLDASASRLDFRRYWELRRILRGADGSIFADTLGDFRWLARHELARLHLLRPLKALRNRLWSSQGKRQHVFDLRESLHSTRNTNEIELGAGQDCAEGMTPFQAKYFRHFHVGTQTYFANFDRSSMAHGIEVRMPFTDWRIVTFLFALPPASKNGGGYTKRILRLAMDGRTPDAIRLQRSKIPFVSPMNHWARGALRPWLLDLCSSRSFNESSLWDGPSIRRVIERAVEGKTAIEPVWPIIHAYVLEKTFRVRAQQKTASL